MLLAPRRATRGPQVAARIGAELRALFALDPAEQRATPLQVVRGAVREPTAILATAGVAAVDRDPFEERAFPDDRYGLVPERARRSRGPGALAAPPGLGHGQGRRAPRPRLSQRRFGRFARADRVICVLGRSLREPRFLMRTRGDHGTDRRAQLAGP